MARIRSPRSAGTTGRPYADYGLPVPLDDLRRLRRLVRRQRRRRVEQTLVTGLAGRDGQFELSLADGKTATARRVVLATGVEHFAHMPPSLSGQESVSHSSTITEPAAFSGQRVAVIGRGQSALESAALLRENGAEVEIITRSAGCRLERAAAAAGPAAAAAAAGA